MVRIDLNVPYSEKDEAKSLGAKWDWVKKIWYVPDGVNPRPFARWLPSEVDDDLFIRAERYYIGQTSKTCWKCEKQTRVYGFLLDENHELLTDYESPDSDRLILSWEYVGEPMTVSNIQHLPDSIQKRIGELTGSYYPDTSQTAGGQYWMNHCDRCGAKQGDFYIHEELGPGGFFPVEVKDARLVTLYRVDEPFKIGSCNHGGPVCHFKSMKMVPYERRPGRIDRWFRRLFKTAK